MTDHQPLPDWVPEYLRQHQQQVAHIGYVVSPPTLFEVAQEFPEVEYEPELITGELQFARGTADDQGHGLTVLALYLIARRNETPHSFAMILATQRAPGVETTDTFWAGRKRFDQVFGERYADGIKAGFAKKGINFRNGDEYCPELVRPNMGFSPLNPDPEAILPFDDARGRMKKLLTARGWESHGAVTTEHREPLTDPHAREACVPVAPELVDRFIHEECAANPDLRKKPKVELRELVIDKHGPSK
jgi:hypothetical protein